MPYRAQFSQRHDTTHDATQNAVLRDEVSSLLQPAIKLPSSGTHLGGTFLPATPSLNAKAVIHALRAKPRKTSLLRGSAPIARHKGLPQSSALVTPSAKERPPGTPSALVQTSALLRPFRSGFASSPRVGRPLPLHLATPAFARWRSAYGCRDSIAAKTKARTQGEQNHHEEHS